MNAMEKNATQSQAAHPAMVIPAQLLEEIHYLQGRVARLERDANCAYENALLKSYRRQVQERLAQLGRLGRKAP